MHPHVDLEHLRERLTIGRTEMPPIVAVPASPTRRRAAIGSAFVASLIGMWLLPSAFVHPAQAQTVQSEYQSVVEKGLEEFALGNYSEARTFFQRAHRLSPSARTLRSLGMTSYELRRYVEAQEYLQQALASDVRPLTPQLHQEVTELLKQARSFIAKLQLTVTPETAQVRVDTQQVYRDAQGLIMLDPGTHELTVDAFQYEAVARNIRCDGSETVSLTIRLPKTSNTQFPAAVSDESTAAPYILMAGSAAVAVAGGVLLTIALSNKHAAENPDQRAPDGARYADYQARADSVPPLSAAGIAALCAGGIGLATGLIWKLSSRDRPVEKSASASLSFTATGVAFQARY
jgi:tetratricopeptide (TPR) repeat protein